MSYSSVTIEKCERRGKGLIKDEGSLSKNQAKEYQTRTDIESALEVSQGEWANTEGCSLYTGDKERIPDLSLGERGQDSRDAKYPEALRSISAIAQ